MTSSEVRILTSGRRSPGVCLVAGRELHLPGLTRLVSPASTAVEAKEKSLAVTATAVRVIVVIQRSPGFGWPGDERVLEPRRHEDTPGGTSLPGTSARCCAVDSDGASTWQRDYVRQLNSSRSPCFGCARSSACSSSEIPSLATRASIQPRGCDLSNSQTNVGRLTR
jgi:hypothetical protein